MVAINIFASVLVKTACLKPFDSLALCEEQMRTNERERERETKTDKKREGETEKQRDRQTHRQRQRDRENLENHLKKGYAILKESLIISHPFLKMHEDTLIKLSS
jgi:exonuclease VII large subunit